MENQRLVRIYYLGGFPDNAIVQSKQQAFVVPPIGGHLEVPTYIARDLLRRNTIYFSTNPRDAELALRGEVALETPPPPKFSKEALQVMLAELEAEEAAAQEPEVPSQEQEAVPVSRRKSKEPKVEVE